MNQVELDLAQTEFYDFLTPVHSYVSVVELGLYESTRKTYEAADAKGLEAHTPEWEAEMASTLKRQSEAMAPRLFSRRARRQISLLLSHEPQARRGGQTGTRSPLPTVRA